MDITQIVKLVAESGMGVVAFVALLFGGWKILQWLEEVKTNHLPHVQAALDKQTDLLEKHGEKLDKIVEQTRKT